MSLVFVLNYKRIQARNSESLLQINYVRPTELFDILNIIEYVYAHA